MPHFYFHLKIGRKYEYDEIGLELPSLEAAYLEAFATAQEMWPELLAERSDPTSRVFEITDEAGQALMRVPFMEVLERARKGTVPGRRNTQKTLSLLSQTTGLAASLIEQLEQARSIVQETQKTLRRSSLQRGRSEGAQRFKRTRSRPPQK